MTAYSSTSSTRDAGTDLTYCSPGDTVYRQEARQPSAQRTQPSHQPVYQAPSSCCTSTAFGSSKRRTSSLATAQKVGQE